MTVTSGVWEWWLVATNAEWHIPFNLHHYYYYYFLLLVYGGSSREGGCSWSQDGVVEDPKYCRLSLIFFFRLWVGG